METTRPLDAGIQANTRLRSESSMDGEAYRILVDSGKRPAVDLSNDPMFNQTDEIRSNDFMQGFKENFADCSRKDVLKNARLHHTSRITAPVSA